MCFMPPLTFKQQMNLHYHRSVCKKRSRTRFMRDYTNILLKNFNLKKAGVRVKDILGIDCLRAAMYGMDINDYMKAKRNTKR